MSSQAALLQVEDVTIRFGGIVALDRVSFSIAAGEICGLIGPNGAGKTTMFNCLSRLFDVETGQIIFAGQDLGALPRHRVASAGLGRTFQNLAMFRSMSVLDNVLIGRHSRLKTGFLANALRTRRVREEERLAEARARELIEMLELGPVAHVRAADLPFGTQKRVELARALASEPRLLLLDEPAAGLNHEEVDALGAVVRRVRDRIGVTVLLVEHHMGLVMGVSDKVVALNFGRKIADGTPEEVRSHPDVVQAYLGGTA